MRTEKRGGPMSVVLDIGGHLVGEGLPGFIIAEIGNNHNGNKALARQMVLAAADGGADAVKLQAYQTALFLSPASQFYGELDRERLSLEDQLELFRLAESKGCLAFATPFDVPTLERLCREQRPALKIASGDISNWPLLRAAGASGLPVLLSTGASSLAEVERAVSALGGGREQCVLLHCTVQYPARDEDVNLRAMETLRAAFGLPVGLSDHTEGVAIALAALALGAVVVEKHFTTDRTLPGGDNEMSILPDELRVLTSSARRIHLALGSGDKQPSQAEAALQAHIRRSPTALCDIAAGETLGGHNLGLLRPGTGLPPETYDVLLGKRARRPVRAGEPLDWSHVER